jgi:hypothetical protein
MSHDPLYPRHAQYIAESERETESELEALYKEREELKVRIACWEDNEVARATCCMKNEQRAEAAEAQLREAIKLLCEGEAPYDAGDDYSERVYVFLAKHASTPREAPLPPEVLADALQDRVHPTSGRLLSASPVREAPKNDDRCWQTPMDMHCANPKHDQGYACPEPSAPDKAPDADGVALWKEDIRAALAKAQAELAALKARNLDAEVQAMNFTIGQLHAESAALREALEGCRDMLRAMTNGNPNLAFECLGPADAALASTAGAAYAARVQALVDALEEAAEWIAEGEPLQRSMGWNKGADKDVEFVAKLRAFRAFRGES